MLTLLLLSCNPPPAAEAVPTCAGHAELCDRRLDEVALPATHNSMSNAKDGWSWPNQGLNLSAQLDDGVRGFLMDTYEQDGELYLCHSYCDLGSIPLADALKIFADFLQAHPDEVLVFILQDSVSAEATEGAFEAAGLAELTWTWDGGELPTLGEMIDSGQRLVVTAEVSGPPPAWYMSAWDLFWDNPYDYTSADEFSCELNRGATTNPLFLLNHWLGPLPSEEAAASVNTALVLGEHAERCVQETGRIPTLVAVDHYELGELFEVVNALNGL